MAGAGAAIAVAVTVSFAVVFGTKVAGIMLKIYSALVMGFLHAMDVRVYPSGHFSIHSFPDK